MKQKRVQQNKFSENILIGIKIILILLVYIFLMSAANMDKSFFLKYSLDGKLSSGTIEKIGYLRMYLSIFAFVLLGILFYLENIREKAINFIERHKEPVMNIILFTSIILIILIVGELSCRAVFYEQTANNGRGPGAFVYFHKYVSVNENMMREFNYEYEKPNNTIRIAVLGDSYTFGSGLKNFNQSYSKLLEKELNRNEENLSYQVLNFAVLGMNTSEQIRVFTNLSLKYKPDILIIGYCLNKFDNVDSNLGSVNELDKPLLGLSWLRQVSYLFFYIETKVNNFHESYLEKQTYNEKLLDIYNSQINLEYNQNLFKELSKSTKENNISVIVVIFPMIYNLNDYPFSLTHNIVCNMSKSNNFSCIDLLKDYQDYSPNQLIVNNYDTHPNELGHKIAADEIYNKLVIRNEL